MGRFFRLRKRLFVGIWLAFFSFYSPFLCAAPKRIVCLAPSVTEIVYALGAGDSVIGISNFSDYPPQAQGKTKVGPFTAPNLETIISLKPDLVIGLKDANPAWIFKRLKSFHIPCVVLKNGGIDSIWDNILVVGRALDKRPQATELVARLKRRLNQLKKEGKKFSKVKVFFQLSLRPLFTCGQGSYLNELIELAGGINIASDISIPYPALSLEKVIAEAPQVIILCLMQEDVKQALKFWEQFPEIPAVREHRLYAVNPDIFARPSPRIVRALETLVNLLHLEASRQER